MIVDNGRSQPPRASPTFRGALACIRCGACMNTCPVFRRSGGYSYGWTVPGPIGSVLAPGRDLAAHASLPFASSLCGSCDDVCPVKIALHEQLLARRRRARARAGARPAWRSGSGWGSRAGVLAAPRALRAGRAARAASRCAAPRAASSTAAGTSGAAGASCPPPPRESFRDVWRRPEAAVARSREEILSALRAAARRPRRRCPTCARLGVQYADPLAQFATRCRAWAAPACGSADPAALGRGGGARSPRSWDAERVASLVPAAGPGNVTLGPRCPTRTSSRGSTSRSCPASSPWPRTARSG